MREIFFVMLFVMLCGTLMAADPYDKMFDSLDKNGDQNLSKREFMEGKMEIDRGKAVKLFPGLHDVKNLSEKDLRERLFERMDENHNGLLSRDEWRRVAPNILIIRF